MRNVTGISTGIGAMCLGALSIVTVAGAQHCESLRDSSSAYLLNTAERLGWIHQPSPDAVVELRAPGLFAFTDETALQAVFLYGICLGMVSVLLSVWAEYRNEENLHLSAGFICGAGGLFLASRALGIFVAATGTLAVFLLRRARRARACARV